MKAVELVDANLALIGLCPRRQLPARPLGPRLSEKFALFPLQVTVFDPVVGAGGAG